MTRAVWPDRIVHGETADGWDIVRYDRAGKWFIENREMIPNNQRRQISVREAAELALKGKLYPGRYGGRSLYAHIKKIQKEQS